MKHSDMSKHLDMCNLGMEKKPSNVAARIALGVGRIFNKAGEPLEITNTGLDAFKVYCVLEGLSFTLEFSSKPINGKCDSCIMCMVLTFPPMVRVFEEHKIVSALHTYLGSMAEEKGVRVVGGSQVRNFPRIIDGVGRYTTLKLSYVVEVPKEN